MAHPLTRSACDILKGGIGYRNIIFIAQASKALSWRFCSQSALFIQKEIKLRKFISLSVLALIWAPAMAAATANQEKLIGKWCYTHMEIGGEKSQENIPYEFFENGEFSFKNSSTASRTRKAKYTLDGSKLRIGGLAPGGLEIVELNDTKMVAKGGFSALRHFKKGACE